MALSIRGGRAAISICGKCELDSFGGSAFHLGDRWAELSDGDADYGAGRDCDFVFLVGDPQARKGILHSAVAAADGHAGRFHVVGFRAVLRVLGSDAGADVFSDWRMGRRAAVVRGDQIFPVHAGRIGADAPRDPGDLLLPQYFRRAHDSGASLPRAGWVAAEVALLAILFRVCNQGAGVPVPHVVAGRAH